jgi:hypothetical protein
MKVRGLVAAAALIALGTGAVIAQSDPIAARKELITMTVPRCWSR